MHDTQKDDKAPVAAEPQIPANDPGPDAAPAAAPVEPEADAGITRADLEARDRKSVV